MERLKARAKRLVVSVAVVIVPAAIAQNDIKDPDSFPGAWYRIAFDSSGNYLYGDGHGYGGGTWYFYPQTAFSWFLLEPGVVVGI